MGLYIRSSLAVLSVSAVILGSRSKLKLKTHKQMREQRINYPTTADCD